MGEIATSRATEIALAWFDEGLSWQGVASELDIVIKEAKTEERQRIKKILDEEMHSSALIENFIDKYKEVFDA